MKVFVFAATGAQGSSVCKYALDAGYQVYGLTRTPSSTKAKALATSGVHVVQGDMADPASYTSHLNGQAFDAAFINTDFFSKFIPNGGDSLAAQKGEVEEGIAAADACIAAGVKHIIYSTLDEVAEGACAHFESKAAVSKYIQEKKYPYTNLYVSSYYSNFTKRGMLHRISTEDGGQRWVVDYFSPDDTEIATYADEETGLWVLEAWKNPEKWIGKSLLGKDMHACSEFLTIAEMADILTRVTGVPVGTPQITKEFFYSDAHKQALGEEIWASMKGVQRDIEASKQVVPNPMTMEVWARQSSELRKLLGI
ncbi:hypothetical protein L202_06310 [Cryptococcus amylolentus CBS 6039]|uniref:NmrA-like domain-containing protein n=1 Tax=Cryptococcus amylolentus CBS 6039 TaxID=1295533 RepID=A0A1E3HFJ9_9TREE|nr:hypothetical protein L202_06310 [Cryptococcus amylolentus CBS 6039]ODN75094.1 hypothetical protein L202_06310 [Cryptococcus amylolentus CBS 6039]